MSPMPLHQRIIFAIAAVLAGLLAFGDFLHAIHAAISVITPAVTYIGTILLVAVAVVAQFVLRRHPITWLIEGQLTRIRGLRVLPLAFLVGMVALLWVPRLFTHSPAGHDAEDKLQTTPFTPTSESPTTFTSEEARLAIDPLIREFPGMSKLRISSITSPVNGISAVVVEPPYREFPNVVLFRYDEGAKRWKRVMEALCIGIQPEVSTVLDLHTIGMAVDIEQPATAEQRRYLADIGAGAGWVVISYVRFTHSHPSGREMYYIDKRDFRRFAKWLFPTTKGYKDDNTCTIYDMPELSSVSLSHDSGRFKLTALTVNHQEWKVTFTGIDGSGHLDQKVITAEPTDQRGQSRHPR